MSQHSGTPRKIALLPPGTVPFMQRRAVEAAGLALFALAAALALALASYHPDDGSLNVATTGEPANWLGVPGAYAADLLLQGLGLASTAVVGVMACWAWRIASHRGLPWYGLRLVLALPCLLLLAACAATITAPEQWPQVAGLGGYGGDWLLRTGATPLALLSLTPHSPLVTAALSITALLLLLYLLGIQLTEWLALARAGLSGLMHTIGAARFAANTAERLGRQAATHPMFRREPRMMADDETVEAGPLTIDVGERITPERTAARVSKPKRATKKSRRAQKEQQPALALSEREDYQLPALHLLATPERQQQGRDINESALEQNARMLETVLDDYGVHGRIVQVRPGPVVTLYELEPAPGTKTSRVVGLSDDIARSMSARSVRIAVVPGRNAIGIELPNRDRETVYLRELLSTADYEKSKLILPLALGKDISGAPVLVDLAKMPHLLIAGTTGSGKSVAINTMILSLLYCLPPERCRMIMIDPKMLELSVYDDIPHLLTPVVTDPGKAIMALKWAVREMENRYRAMASLGVRNIVGYNQRLAEAEKRGEELKRTVQTGYDAETGQPVFEDQLLDTEPMPYIVVIVDEMADLMMVAGKEIDAAVQRLAQMARAAGIHVMMATQRPSVDVITGTIKANFPTRVSFQVTAKVDSRTILGEQGAEQLLGMGDMLYMAGGGRISRVHGPFVGDEEVESVVNHLKRQGRPEYLDAVTEDNEGGAELDMVQPANDGSNTLFDQAVDVVARNQKASTSFLQRQLKIGYNRAADLIDRMEIEGVIGRANHVGKREILVRNPDEDN
ncbi:MAG: DNA translocase FtsK 4TM domain-containing protein [Alphaproteobacteria bacterium]|jgi:S-DNA-T family DNA segregation ATPase FtsK/SpoIIIE|nr:DNA translocase FtsK 4TM domain-containing protein [Alphaproteobacteria bacterium]MDP6872698.1 DNA translocase FtsK 4TM domain-containing protein [Alphaproteobacteria bacterium]